MAIVHVTTTNGAVAPEERAALAAKLGTPTCENEGFAGSALAPTPCWTWLDEQRAMPCQPAPAIRPGLSPP